MASNEDLTAPPPSPVSPGINDNRPAAGSSPNTTSRPLRWSYTFERIAAPTKNMLPLLLLTDADTLVFIDPAPEDRSKNNILIPSIPHRVHSEKLLATKSPYFQRLFSPQYQARLRKRRDFADNLPAGVKYVIDLTPPTMDEEAIIVLTEVSCPMGIRTWATRLKEWSLPPSCVGGEDEMEAPSPVLERAASHTDRTLTAFENDETHPHAAADWEDEGQPPHEEDYESWSRRVNQAVLPMTYSAKRHREGIEHILHVLEGLNVPLDTPCKLWTFFAVAKIFDVAGVPAVSDHVMSWFYHSSNIRFIEIHPEIAYRVSCGIKSGPLCADSFVGLVGDEALLYIMREASLTPPNSWAPILARSRIADFLDDIEVQRIEYASKSFADKIIGDFLYLAGADMPWIAKVEEYERIEQHLRDFPEDAEVVSQLVTELKDFIRFRIYRVLCLAPDPRRSCNITPSDQVFSDANKFRPPELVQRVIGRQFWRDLFHLDLDSTYLPSLDYHHHSIAEIGNGMTAFQGHDNAWIRCVLRLNVEQKVRGFNSRVRYQASKIAFHPSKRNALRSDSSDFSESSVNLRRPFQAAQPTAPTDDGHSKPLAMRFRDPQTSHPAQGEGNSTAIRSLVHRPHYHSSDEKMTTDYASSTLSPAFSHFDSYDEKMTTEHSSSTLSPIFPFDSYDENRTIEHSSGTLSPNFPLFSMTTIPAILSPTPNSTSNPLNTEERYFNLGRFFYGATKWVNQLSRTLLFPHGDATAALEATDTLFSLTDEQFRYLPLWAGGNDDGSGGVFTDQNIPVMETGGFSAPGPAVHTGSVASTHTDSSFGEIGPDDYQSTVHGASHHATFSHASDLLSVDSFRGTSQGSLDERSREGGLATSVPVSTVFSDDEDDFDVQSDGGDTVIMSSTRLSDIDDDYDVDMKHLDILDNDNHEDQGDSDDRDYHYDNFELIDSN
ncbi:hypothetical protein F1880_003102 [Penicillium rolfsii]|nr:hypothetical protein F1880_003102 [Penicillium rolfsii]